MSSLAVTQDEVFDTPIEITVLKKLSNFDIEGPMMYVAYPYTVLGAKIDFPPL